MKISVLLAVVILLFTLNSATPAAPSIPQPQSADSSNFTTESLDKMGREILSQIITKDMDAEQQIKAVYDFLIYQFLHIKLYNTAYKETHKDKDADKRINYQHIPLSEKEKSDAGNAQGAKYLEGITVKEIEMLHSYLFVNNVANLLINGEGDCADFADTFTFLLRMLDIDSIVVRGEYINRNGSTYSHVWNYIKADGTWYWYDVDIEGIMYRTGSANELSYSLYKKDTDYWKKNHSWDEDAVQKVLQKGRK